MSAAEPLIKVPKSNCLCGSKARRGCNIWTASVRQKGGKPTAVSKETVLLDCADWINTASDWLVTVYSPRANQRHRICPPMHRSSISARPLPQHPPFLHPDKKDSQSDDSLSLFSVCNLWWLIRASPTEVLSDPPGVTAKTIPPLAADQQQLPAPPGPCALISMMPANK